mgnify:CR=1 FL=1
MDSLIRWKREDSERLTKAVNKFNREVKALKNENITLPSKANYNDLRDHISSRRELEEIIDLTSRYHKKLIIKLCQ